MGVLLMGLLPMDVTYWVTAGGTHSGIVTLYLRHFHQSLGCIYIKKRCIIACAWRLLNLSNNQALQTGSITVFIFIGKVR